MPDDPTLGELRRSLDTVRHDCATRAAGHVERAVYEAHREADRDLIANLRADLAAVSERLTWAFRAAVAGLALPIIVGLVLALLLYGRT